MSGLFVEKRGDVAILWIDQPGRSVALLDMELLEALPKMVDELDKDQDVRAVVLANAKRGTFLAGADVASFLEYENPAQIEARIHEGNAFMARLEAWRKPLVVAVDGVCLGGGTELALAGRYLLASTGPKTYFGLPEVQLGLLPGLGGTVRLPERIGLTAALDLILTGRNLYAKQARRAGLVHATVHPEGLIDAAVRAAGLLADGKLDVPKRRRKLMERLLEETPARALVFDRAAKQVEARTHGNYPAPRRILEVLAAWARGGRHAGLDASAKAFAELLFTPEARALIHLFFAQTAAKKNPWPGQALKVESVGVLGAGLMGSGIAEVTAAHGMNVLLKDRDLELALKGKAAVYRGLSGRVGKGRTAFERDRLAERVSAVDRYEAMAGTQLTIEAVLEQPDLKRQMVAEIERVVGAEQHVFASNTSAIPISEIAAGARRPEAVLGMHYFSPVPKMPLLEVVVTGETADWAAATAFEVGSRQGKTTIVVHDGPGFYTTRVLSVYIAEAMRALHEGAAPADLERAMVAYGFPLGPLALMDDVGIDVGAKIEIVLAPLMAARGLEVSPASQKLVDAGYLGRKAGKGFYKYEGGHRKKEFDEEALRVAGFARHGAAAVEQGAALADRLALTFVREAALCLEEGVLRSARDGDVGAVFGLGFPPFRGGPFYLVDQEGPAAVVARLRALEARHGARFSPPESLVTMAEGDERYYEGQRRS
ncbi:MAG TPA: 3-hydroxyacyl-CoA dehydrogenase NAD-binding domain-containing protein [Trueperaceae bacterium]|nr:3-hydroxyacyl-CoA dehydrogenase NAD-binding domain-containing protein [Trueperaceae bacterium]